MSQPARPTPEPPKQQAISLHELTEAFAEAMGRRPEPHPQPAEPESEPPLADAGQPADAEPARPWEEPLTPTAADDSCPVNPTSILEALVFVGHRDGQPLTPQQASDLMRGVEPGEVPALVDELNRRYEANGCPYQIIGEDAGYRLTLRKAFHRLRDKFYGRVREARLSQAAIDILAIVAYQQPVTAEQIRKIRGKPATHLLAHLVRRGLLRLVRPPAGKRTPQYYTADRFLELFGLERLEDLPQSEELDRL